MNKTQRRRRIRDSHGAPEGFTKKVMRRRAEAKAEGKTPPCECWDCLRESGLTPPKRLREAHPRKYPPQVLGEDPGGDPIVTTNKRSKGDSYGASSTERSHLREAVRNRSAI